MLPYGAPMTEFTQALNETDEKACHDLQRVLDHIGEDKARTLLTRAQDIEAEGGMMTRDGSRRRTLGGVFFQLAREHMPHTPPPPKKVRLQWNEAAQAAAEALDADEHGEAPTVKITLIGRPGRVITRDTMVVTTMHNHKRPTLPKQLPKLSGADVETKYTVFIAAKQWRKVKDALQDKEDALIIEGYPFIDPDVKGVCVFAKSTTTKHLQRAMREKQREQKR